MAPAASIVLVTPWLVHQLVVEFDRTRNGVMAAEPLCEIRQPTFHGAKRSSRIILDDAIAGWAMQILSDRDRPPIATRLDGRFQSTSSRFVLTTIEDGEAAQVLAPVIKANIDSF